MVILAGFRLPGIDSLEGAVVLQNLLLKDVDKSRRSFIGNGFPEPLSPFEFFTGRRFLRLGFLDQGPEGHLLDVVVVPANDFPSILKTT